MVFALVQKAKTKMLAHVLQFREGKSHSMVTQTTAPKIRGVYKVIHNYKTGEYTA